MDSLGGMAKKPAREQGEHPFDYLLRIGCMELTVVNDTTVGAREHQWLAECRRDSGDHFEAPATGPTAIEALERLAQNIAEADHQID